MPDTKITALTAISTVDPAVDVLPIVDVSDTTMAASGTTKKITSNQILGAGGTATLASATITGDLTVATNGLKVDSANKNVGINTATPTNTAGYKTLEIVGTGVNTGGMLRFKSSDTSVNTLDFADSNGRAIFAISNHPVRFGCNDIEQYRINPLGVFTWYDGAGGTRMTLNSTGLGVGASPTAKVHVVGGAAQNPLILDSTGYNHCVLKVSGTNRGQFYADATNCFAVVNSAGSATPFVVTDTGNVGIGVTPSAWSAYKAVQIGRGSFSSDTSSSTATSTLFGSNFVYDGNWKYIVAAAATFYQQTGGVHYWFNEAGTKAAGATFTPVQAMTLDASGNLLVGKTAASVTTVGFQTLANGEASTAMSSSTNAATTWNVYSTGAAAYRFYVGMGGTVYATNTTISAISDQRLKENVQDIDVGLGAILALKPRKFDWKTGKGKDIKGDRGFIAQEFEQVFPQLVDEWADPAPEGETPYKSVRQDLIPVLVKAIQELAAEVNALKNA